MSRSAAQLHALGESSYAGSSDRRAYSDAFKRDAVEKARTAKSVSQVARDLGVSRNSLMAWMKEPPAAPMTLLEAVRSGSRKQYLIALRDDIAETIANGVSARDKPANVRILNETIRELAELEAQEQEDASDPSLVPDDDLDPDDL